MADIATGAATGATAGSSVPILGTLLGAGIGTLGSIAGGLLGGNSAEEAAKWQFNARKKIYEDMLKKAGLTQQQGESALSGLTSTPLAELGTMKQDVLNQTNDVLNSGSRSLQANLAQAGLRGGQAATQLARGVGNMTTSANQNINQLTYDEAQKRKANQTAYEMAKAQAGTSAQLQIL